MLAWGLKKNIPSYPVYTCLQKERINVLKCHNDDEKDTNEREDKTKENVCTFKHLFLLDLICRKMTKEEQIEKAEI